MKSWEGQTDKAKVPRAVFQLFMAGWAVVLFVGDPLRKVKTMVSTTKKTLAITHVVTYQARVEGSMAVGCAVFFYVVQ